MDTYGNWRFLLPTLLILCDCANRRHLAVCLCLFHTCVAWLDRLLPEGYWLHKTGFDNSDNRAKLGQGIFLEGYWSFGFD